MNYFHIEKGLAELGEKVCVLSLFTVAVSYVSHLNKMSRMS